MNNLLELIAERPTQDPTYLSINDLVEMVAQQSDDDKSQAFLAGVLCAVTLQSILTNFTESDQIINKIQNQNIKQMLLGVQHARMTLSTF